MTALRMLVRLSMVFSISLFLFAAPGCGGNSSTQGDIGAAGYVPDDVPADSDAALAEIEDAEDDD